MTTTLPGNAIDAHIHRPSDPGAGIDWATLPGVLQGAGMSRAVLVSPEPAEAAAEEAVRLGQDSPSVAAIAAWADLTEDDVVDALDKLKQSRKVRAVAVRAADQPENHWLVRDDVVRGLRAAAERGLALDVEIEPRQVPSVGRLAELVPELRIAVAHLGSPFIARSEREPWGVYMLNVAPHRNIHVKVSGLVTLDTERWKVAHHRLFVESVVRLFGYDRLMFGSDWPNHLARATYEQVVEAAYEASGPLTSTQAERLFHGTASEFYGLD